MIAPQPAILISSGEPAGIGPELMLRLGELPAGLRRVVLCDRQLLMERATLLKQAVCLADYQPQVIPPAGTLEVMHLPLATPSRPGQPAAANATYVLAMLDRAIAGCLDGEFAALVTGPVHKGIINDAGIAFTGHTEYLAEKTGRAQVVMMLACQQMRVALATTHLPLRAVADAITVDRLAQTLRILQHDLRTHFGIPSPRILVAGLNPHAGEGGHMGREEIDVIQPVLEHLRQQGMQLTGPLPADTLFTPKYLEQADAVLAMYHDQGLPVLKYADFEQAVNITLGLPFIRTSVDHGTALDLAGLGLALPSSLFAAIRQAETMLTRFPAR